MSSKRGGSVRKILGNAAQQILARGGRCCAYCGRGTLESGGKLHLDHVVPLHLGGDYSPANLVPACGRCNLAKGSLPFGAWVAKASGLGVHVDAFAVLSQLRAPLPSFADSMSAST